MSPVNKYYFRLLLKIKEQRKYGEITREEYINKIDEIINDIKTEIAFGNTKT